jgi:hypothetical protein
MPRVALLHSLQLCGISGCLSLHSIHSKINIVLQLHCCLIRPLQATFSCDACFKILLGVWVSSDTGYN